MEDEFVDRPKANENEKENPRRDVDEQGAAVRAWLAILARVILPVALLVAATDAPLVLVLLAHHLAAAPLLAAEIDVALEGGRVLAALLVADAGAAPGVLGDLEL